MLDDQLDERRRRLAEVSAQIEQVSPDFWRALGHSLRWGWGFVVCGLLAAGVGYLLRHTELSAPSAGACVLVALFCVVQYWRETIHNMPLYKRRSTLRNEQLRLQRELKRSR